MIWDYKIVIYYIVWNQTQVHKLWLRLDNYKKKIKI